MATINIIVGPQEKTKFSGGSLCIFEYAHGLHRKGHKVRIIPSLPSPYPEWFGKNFGEYISNDKMKHPLAQLKNLIGLGYQVGTFGFSRSKEVKKNKVNKALLELLISQPSLAPFQVRRAISFEYLQKLIPTADITIATHYETARPVKLFGKGRLFYFAQHYEPYFKNESPNPELSEEEAKASYSLGLTQIVNSSWLKQIISRETGNPKIFLSPNAIDHKIYYGDPKNGSAGQSIKLISYGGRDAVWKGFREMAEAVKIARNSLPNHQIHWDVYGSALLPPNNTIAKYHPLGFLKPPRLAEAYRNSDILLSASWYESFPLFPLEAMACGIPVITTPLGTEDYGIHGKTAEIVEPKSPESIAKGLIRMIKDTDYRKRITIGGNNLSKTFSWDRSVGNFEKILLEGIENY